MVTGQILFNKQEALRYFRAQQGDVQAEAAIDKAYEKLNNELQPRYTARRFCCEVNENSVRLDNGAVFHSRALARYMEDAKELFLFGATLGSCVDMVLRRISLTSVAEAGAAQAAAAALIETYCDDCCSELRKQLPEGKKLKWRFSPGYGDWALEEQKLLFPALDCAHTIGLTLTESCMMAPIKSVTAVIAIIDENEKAKGGKKIERSLKNKNCNASISSEKNSSSLKNFYDECNEHKNKCRYCGKADCDFRRKE